MKRFSAAFLLGTSSVMGLPAFDHKNNPNTDHCTDLNGRQAMSGDYFTPSDPCQKCLCYHGKALTCAMVQCTLSDCNHGTVISDECCPNSCVSLQSSAAVTNASEMSWNVNIGYSYSVSLWLLAAATFMLISIVLVYISRYLRRHQVLISVRHTDNYLSCREDGSSDVSRVDRNTEASVSLPSFGSELAPPAYTSPKPSYLPPAYDEAPPPPRYEDLLGAQRINC